MRLAEGTRYHAGSSGSATVRGAGTVWTNNNELFAGNYGSGALTIEAGGRVDTYDAGYLGYRAGSSGMATVSGSGSAWTSGYNMFVGYLGSGALTIEAGAQVSDTTGYIGRYSDSSGTAVVTGAGSKWINREGLIIGHGGTGALAIAGGGQVSNTYGDLGREAGSSGAVSVSGAGSMWTCSDRLYVGMSGRGMLTVADGGLVTAQTLFASLSDLHGDGTIMASGAVLNTDWVFDGSHGTTQTLAFGTGGTLTLSINGSGALGAGFKGSGDNGAGSLRIAEGVAIASSGGHLGEDIGSNGTATVNGAGSKWTITGGSLYVGRSGNGTLNIEGGGQVRAMVGYVGFNSGSAGTITVKGTGSTWTNTNGYYIGYSGTGTLNVEEGGQASTSMNSYLGYGAGSNGTATVRGLGSSWTTTKDLYVGASGAGVLIIEAGAQVSNNSGTLGNSGGAAGTVMVTGARSKWTNSGDLTVGSSGSGVLTIEAGGQVSNKRASLGAKASATVSGAESIWASDGPLFVWGKLTVMDGGLVTAQTVYASSADLLGNGTISATGAVLDGNLILDSSNSTAPSMPFGSGGKLNLLLSGAGTLGVGFKGNGSLRIDEGSVAASSDGCLGYDSRAIGTAMVSGEGSTWVNSGPLAVGFNGTGVLTVADGGKVAATMLNINNKSTVRLSVSGDDMLVLGSAAMNGILANNGTFSMVADVSLPVGIYRPISAYPGKAIIWSGSGSYKAFGGTWDKTAKTFTVLAPTPLSAGESDTLTTGERLLFTDSLTGHRVGASFGTITGTVNFSAAPMATADLSGLAVMLEDGQGVLNAWTFTTNFTGGEAMLSFDIGPDAENLSVWHYSNGVWSSFTPSLFTYDANGLASFTVSSFSGYALTAAVPEPASLSLLAFAGSILLARRRK